MKTTLLTLAAAGLVAAQQIPEDLPSCALGCLATAIPAAGCSGPTDFQCACENIEKIMASNMECFTTNCDPEELMKAQSAAQELCSGLVATTTVMGSVIPDPTGHTQTDSLIEPSATTTVMGSVTPDPTGSMTGTPVSTMTTVTSDSSSDEPSSTGSEDASNTSSDASATTTAGSSAGKPLAGAGIALLAAIAAL